MTETITVGSLFAGIGGMDLGLERADMKVRWQVEIDPFCQRVLQRHWPDIERYGDVSRFPPGNDWTEYNVDIICGGFPCQDISVAGHGRGLAGSRSGLWWEMFRVVKGIKPQFVVIENTPPLFDRGLHQILDCLAQEGFDAEWEIISAKQFGFAHLRERLYIVAYANGIRWDDSGNNAEMDYGSSGWSRIPEANGWQDGWDVERWVSAFYSICGFPPSDPATKRVVDGIPERLDRVRSCGNAVVVSIIQWIGNRIIRSLQNDKERQWTK